MANDVTIPQGFELVACPGCGNEAFTIARQGRDWYLDPTRVVQVVRCNSCRLHYTNPRPTEAHIAVYYPTDYPPHLVDSNERDEERSTPLRSLVLREAYASPEFQPRGAARVAARVVSILKPPEKVGAGVAWHGKGRLLDFGCGNGKFLRRMASLGWNVTGLDMGEQAVNSVRASGIKAVLGTLPHPQLQPSSYDVVTMRQSLEHVHHPQKILTAAHQLLDDRGLLLVNVPNFDSWEIEYFGDASLSLQLPRHLLHFTPPTLMDLLRRCGFEVLSVKQVCRASWIKRSLTRTERRGEKKWDKWLRKSLVRNAAARYWELKGKGNDLTALARKR